MRVEVAGKRPSRLQVGCCTQQPTAPRSHPPVQHLLAVLRDGQRVPRARRLHGRKVPRRWAAVSGGGQPLRPVACLPGRQGPPQAPAQARQGSGGGSCATGLAAPALLACATLGGILGRRCAVWRVLAGCDPRPSRTRAVRGLQPRTCAAGRCVKYPQVQARRFSSLACRCGATALRMLCSIAARIRRRRPAHAADPQRPMHHTASPPSLPCNWCNPLTCSGWTGAGALSARRRPVPGAPGG